MWNLENTQASGITRLDSTLLVERQNGIVHTGEDALGVVHLTLNVIEKLGIFDTHGNLGSKSGKPFFVFRVEGASPFIKNLAYTDSFACLTEDGHAKYRSGKKTGLFVKRRIKAQIRVGMGYVDRFSRSENSSLYT